MVEPRSRVQESLFCLELGKLSKNFTLGSWVTSYSRETNCEKGGEPC